MIGKVLKIRYRTRWGKRVLREGMERFLGRLGEK